MVRVCLVGSGAARRDAVRRDAVRQGERWAPGASTNLEMRTDGYDPCVASLNQPRTKLQRLGAGRARDIRQTVPGDVRDMRGDSGLSMRGPARHAGISLSPLHGLEQGDHTPDIEVLARVAAVLGCRLNVRLRPGAGPLVRNTE